jgi:hypothetical protein
MLAHNTFAPFISSASFVQRSRLLRLLCAIALLCGFAPVASYAQATAIATRDRVQFGIGLALNVGNVLDDVLGARQRFPTANAALSVPFQPPGTVVVYVPMRMGEFLRVEPELGVFSRKDRQEEQSFGRQRDVELDELFIRIGAGAFYEWKPFAAATHDAPDSSLRLYGGLRFSVMSLWWERNYFDQPGNVKIVNGGDGENVAAVHYALCLGAEYMLGKHFGIGTELQLGRVELGQPEYRYGVRPTIYPQNRSYAAMATMGLIFLRYYF